MDQDQASGQKWDEVISPPNTDVAGKVQRYEVSSTSLFIRRNLSLYQRLTQSYSKELEPPSSPIEKKSIQDKWKMLPSPYPTKKHNNNNRFKSTVEVSKLLTDKTIKAKGTTASGLGRGMRRNRKRPVEYQKSQFSWNQWLTNTNTKASDAPSLSTNHTDANQNSCKKPAKDYVSRSRMSKNPICSSVDHSVQGRIKGKKQRVALQATLIELEQEVQALRSTVNKLRFTNENILCENERLQTLIEIKSIKTCADISKPAVAELLSRTILSKPGDMERYSKKSMDSHYSQSCSNHVSTFVRVCTDTNDEPQSPWDQQWFRRGSEMSFDSQATHRVGDREDNLSSSSSTISGNTMDEFGLYGGKTPLIGSGMVNGVQSIGK